MSDYTIYMVWHLGWIVTTISLIICLHILSVRLDDAKEDLKAERRAKDISDASCRFYREELKRFTKPFMNFEDWK